MKRFYIPLILLILSISVFAITPPHNVWMTFKKMYPIANDVAWSQDDGYYDANFVINGFTKNVWFNAEGEWEMTQTDLVSLDRLSPAVYNAFTSSSYADWVVDDVTMTEFPKWQAIIVIKVGQDNVDIKYQLFYTPKGILLKTRNVSYMHDILGPGTFL
ncbi:PepSY-like domain-containing protein [uncultured Bacteroides sp.]|uniref:PepSY-like domain-containing protein n=1 Tax=uncultured Bacteroides sp. TaxID=162156 RepID=UPI002674BC81|nr:PepSY-like domain-containing protein [uncultured Bacteroides sp.]